MTSPSQPPPSTPLGGRRILLARDQFDDPIARALAQAGARVDALRLTRQVGTDRRAAVTARARLATGAYDWLVITSAAALRYLDARLTSASTRLAAVGPRTAAALEATTGRQVDVVGPAGAEELVEALASAGVGAGSRVLVPQSGLARPVLTDGLQDLGAQVDAVAVYTTVEVGHESIDAPVAQAWSAGAYDAVVVTAGSSAQALTKALGQVPPGTAVVTLGEPSRRAAVDAGLAVAAVAASPTPEGVARAVIAALS